MKVILVFKDRDEQMKKSEYHLSLSLFFFYFYFFKIVDESLILQNPFSPQLKGQEERFLHSLS
jgi:hypothetical protein